ncbi:hypothetical protein [Zobellella endophytica]|uniref:hypothetical protein n=1 Tax=Zobellella endophytica TaxID=2116700 RepID=UPI0011B24BDC|nr:hypothetical protein [Zobellella endophytica]
MTHVHHPGYHRLRVGLLSLSQAVGVGLGDNYALTLSAFHTCLSMEATLDGLTLAARGGVIMAIAACFTCSGWPARTKSAAPISTEETL